MKYISPSYGKIIIEYKNNVRVRRTFLEGVYFTDLKI